MKWVLAVLVALLAGIWLGGHPSHLPAGLRDGLVSEPAAPQNEAIEAVEEGFYRRVGRGRLEDASLEAVIRTLHDPFSHYFPPKVFRQFQESIERRYSGVGVTVNPVRRGLRIASIFMHSPASRAGVKRGDLIVSVNGRSIAGLSSEISTARIKGPSGSTVRLRILRPLTGRTRDVALERRNISVPAAAGRIARRAGHRLGYARLATFSDGAHGELRRVVERLYRRGAEGLVLDLRGNGGGLLTEAVLVSSIFIDRGVVVSTAGRRRPKRVFRATGDALRRRPLVVLVDGDSASASEIVAAALSERRVATLVGVRTFGKGTFQEVIELANGSGINLTVGEYITPTGRHLNHKGLIPPVRAADHPRTRRDEALERALAVLRSKLDPGR